MGYVSPSAEDQFFGPETGLPASKGCSIPGCYRFPSDVTYLPLCKVHLYDAYVDLMKHIRGSIGARERNASAGQSRVRPAVYYLQMNDKIKIGFTTALKTRLRTFHAQPADLLALEPGGRAEEHARHQQFAHLRLAGTELFTPEADLLDHVELCRDTFGDPVEFLD